MARRVAYLSGAAPPGEFGGPWLWAFPVAYVAHAVEEVAGGEGYASWVTRLRGQSLSEAALVEIHLLLAVACAAAVLVARRRRRFYWLVTGIAGVYLGNALLHLILTLGTASYSPGLWSGLAIWLPLGAMTWSRAWSRLSAADLRWGAVIAVTGTVLVSVLALNPHLIPLP